MKTLNLKNIIGTGLCTIFVSSLLFAQETHTSRTGDTDLSKYKTYDWIETSKSSYGNQMYSSDQSAKRQMNSTNQSGDRQINSTNQNANRQTNSTNQSTIRQSTTKQSGSTEKTAGQQTDKMDKNRNSGDKQMSQMGNTSENQMNSAWNSRSRFGEFHSKKEVKDAITTQMKARGFTHDTTNPDMLISFQVLDEPTELRTFSGTTGQSYLGFGPRSTNSTMVPVEEGTVIINFIDAKTGSHIWQGFSSGAFEVEDMDDVSNLDAKVIAIFKEWNFDPFGRR